MKLPLVIILLVWCAAVFADMRPVGASINMKCVGCVLQIGGGTYNGKYYAPRTGPDFESAFKNAKGTTIFNIPPRVRLPVQIETTSKSETTQFGASPIETSTRLVNPPLVIDGSTLEREPAQENSVGPPDPQLGAP